ncbi:MAG: hypothetical protein JKY53_00525 [Flavobacteriales bacterium]|nr:hypothetical protein [Flavobacteriales bacterium]
MPYFLHLWVNGTCTFDKIDAFLRGIWLECCGHMSAFRMAKNASNDAGMFDTIDAFEHLNAGDTHKYNDLMTAANGQIPIEDKLMEHAQKGLKIEYEYDFGSSTELDITVVNEYPIVAPQKLFLMTRNEPINFPCVSCGKNNAIEICTSCSCDGAAEYCAKCAKIHTKECVDFDEYSMPLVNSPRAGVCGYTGGEIDKKRDK